MNSIVCTVLYPRSKMGLLCHIETVCSTLLRLFFSICSISDTSLTSVMVSPMNRSMPLDFQLRDLAFTLPSPTPCDSVLSIRSSWALTKGRSTGSRVVWMSLYILTIRSRLPVCRLNNSTFWYTSMAVCGTSRPSNRKYFTSRSSFTSTGSKLTKSIEPAPPSPTSLLSRGFFSLACELDSIELPQLSMFSLSMSESWPYSAVNSLITSRESSLSRIFLSSVFNLETGCWMRSRRPRHHVRAPAMGGRLEAMRGLSFISTQRRCTSTISTRMDSISQACFFSSASATIGLVIRLSNESSRRKRPCTVEASSNPCRITLPSRLSSSFIRVRNS
mmetsp:Transcript_27105/g.61425  ORF Transcript_27105/g.61425 Transcript_27105/m.61425 type:complete len:332 (-) Transcript_27105:1065-2060(-)